jgi:peroxiredoxin
VTGLLRRWGYIEGMTVSVGDRAPEFSLPDQDKQVVTLADLAGGPVLLVFYPFAFSGKCTGELCRLRDELSAYTDTGVRVLAVSTDPVFALKAFKEAEGLNFPLLSDFWPHGATAQAYGVFNDRAGMALRATFLIDAAGVVRFAEANSAGDVREQSEWKGAVAELAA